MREPRSGGCGHGYVVNSMTRAARYFGGRGGQAFAARSRCEKLDIGAPRHHRLTIGIAREGKGAVRERENYAAVTHPQTIAHVGTHGHGDFDPPRPALADFHAHRSRPTTA